MQRTPTPDDRFSFGLWTVGWTGVDPFGTATRPSLDPWEYAERLAELGAWAISFHDDDVAPFGTDESTRAERYARLKHAADDAGPPRRGRWAGVAVAAVLALLVLSLAQRAKPRLSHGS